MNHDALLAKTQASPAIRRQLKAWLKAGVLENGHFAPTTAGTPQGGTISPLLALIALHGMDEAITRIHPQARVIAYADDCVVLHEDRHVLEQSQQLLRTGGVSIELVDLTLLREFQGMHETHQLNWYTTQPANAHVCAPTAGYCRAATHTCPPCPSVVLDVTPCSAGSRPHVPQS